jgi:hypothetical protein
VLDNLGREPVVAVAERSHLDILPDTRPSEPVSVTMPFDANGVKFAFPTVQLAGGEGELAPATAAIAQQALQLVHPKP